MCFSGTGAPGHSRGTGSVLQKHWSESWFLFPYVKSQMTSHASQNDKADEPVIFKGRERFLLCIPQ